jgi:hypothetical protein
MPDISQSDWKLLRKLHPIALERFCRKAIDELGNLAGASSESAHKRYIDISGRVRERDEELSRMFEEPRRSRAFLCIATLKSRDLITADEYAGFSKEMRGTVDTILGHVDPGEADPELLA